MKNNNLKIFYVYIYVDEKNCPVYVGKGSTNRINKHIENVKKIIQKNGKTRTHFYNYLKKSLLQGCEPKRFICQSNLTNTEAINLEMYLIKLFGRKDKKAGTLLNHTDGREGSIGFKWSEESRKNRSGEGHPLFKKGYLVTGEKNGFYGKHHSKEWGIEHSNKLKKVLKNSKKFQEYQKLRRTGIRKGEKRSTETKKRISEGRKRWINSNITKTKMQCGIWVTAGLAEIEHAKSCKRCAKIVERESKLVK